MTDFNDIYEEGHGVAQLTVGSQDLNGRLILAAPDVGQGGRPDEIVTIDLQRMEMRMGSRQRNAPLMTLDMEEIIIDARSSSVTVKTRNRQSATFNMVNSADATTIFADGQEGHLTVGGTESSGVLRVRDGNQNNIITANARRSQVIIAGESGTLKLRTQSDDRITLDAVEGISVLSEAGTNVFSVDSEESEVKIGGVGQAGTLGICDSGGSVRIEMTGDDGDIRFAAADLAEEFTIAEQALDHVAPGTVMVLDDHGTIVPSETAYDKRVVGVIAGAGAYRPAMILDKQGGSDRRPVAMIGKAYCQVTATETPIAIGDLLTTSDVTGHACVAKDRAKSAGAIIGKALGPLEAGTGMIPVLINMQ